MTTKCLPALAFAALLVLPNLAPAQQAATGSKYATRADLEAQVEELKQQLSRQDDLKKDEIKTLQYELTIAEDRLVNGDFQPSDALLLDVQGMPDMTGTFNLDRQKNLVLPTIDPIPMHGVLYSEAEQAIVDGLSVYIRNPMVRVTVTKRIAIFIHTLASEPRAAK